MAELRQCEFFLLRYVPDVVKAEFVNVGVVLLESGDGDELYTDVRFTRDWRRVRCLDPEVDVPLLESYESELRRGLQSRAAEIINYRGPMSRRDWLLEQMRQSFSGALEVTAMNAVLTESPVAELGVLAKRYLESSLRGHRVAGGRRGVYNAMRGAFERAGVWDFMAKDIAASAYELKGDPLKIDCGYRVGGLLYLFHAMSLTTDLNAAKLLAFSYPEMSAVIEAKDGAKSHLLAITEDGLDFDDDGLAFARTILEDSHIDMANVSQMPAIAERARLELKL